MFIPLSEALIRLPPIERWQGMKSRPEQRLSPRTTEKQRVSAGRAPNSDFVLCHKIGRRPMPRFAQSEILADPVHIAQRCLAMGAVEAAGRDRRQPSGQKVAEQHLVS